MQHTRWPNVFALGDAGSSPNSKTGAAIRKQAPVVVKNLTSVMAGGSATAQYDGYASCPLTTARDKMLLAEFDYTMKPHPSFPPRLIERAEGAQGHVVPQALRAPVHVLEPHAQGPCLTASRSAPAGSPRCRPGHL